MAENNKPSGGDRHEADHTDDALHRLASDPAGHTRGGKLRLATRLRNYLLTGLIIVGPVSITIYIALWFIDTVDAWMRPIVPDVQAWLRQVLPEGYLPQTDTVSIPGVGLVFSILLLTIIGALAANLFGRTVISYGEMMLNRMPIVRNLYSALKQIFETVLSQSNNSFQKVGLIEYPRRGIYSIVFISTETKGEIRHRMEDGIHMLSVFLPTTPNPTSGYLLFVPQEDVMVLDMTVEEGAKLVISAGLVAPEYHQDRLKDLSEGQEPLEDSPQREAAE